MFLNLEYHQDMIIDVIRSPLHIAFALSGLNLRKMRFDEARAGKIFNNL